MEKKLRHKGEVINPLVQSGDKSRALVGFKVMRIIHKCRRQGSGSLSPKGLARALAPSQSYRFVNNSHDLPASGRRPQNFPPKISPALLGSGSQELAGQRRLTSRSDRKDHSRTRTGFRTEFILEQASPEATWLNFKQLTELGSPKDRKSQCPASSPLQVRNKP